MPRHDQRSVATDSSLRTLLRSHVLRSALVPLVVVELSLLALYLAFGQEVAGRWNRELTRELRSSLQAVVDTRAQELSLILASIERQTELLRTEAGILLQGQVRPTEGYRPELYAKGSRGSLYQLKDDGGASIFYASTTPIGAAEQDKIAATEPLDPLLRHAVRDDPHVAAAYFNTHDDLSRYYPFIPNADEQFPPDIQMEDFAFYYAADDAHNPERRVVWTEAYLDPAGNGWMVSSIAPVHRGEVLEGVVGLDVTIPVIAERLLDLDLPYHAPALLLTSDGTLLGLSREAAELFTEGEALLDQAPSKIDDRGERTLEQETPLARLLADPDAAHTLKERIQSPGPLTELDIGEDRYFLVHASIDEPAWSVVVLVNADEVMSPIEAIESRSRTVALWIIGGLALFYGVFFQIIYYRSRRLADRIATPLGRLERATETKEAPASSTKSGIVEIDRLATSFREMMVLNQEHQARIEALNQGLEAEIQQEVRRSRNKDHQLLEQSRLAALGEMVSSIAHQWRQPLTSLQLLIDDLRMQHSDSGSSEELHDYLDDAQLLIQHMNQTIDDFRALYGREPKSETIALRQVVARAFSVADGALKNAGITVELTDENGDAKVSGRPNELCHALLNLLSNAVLILTERKIEQPKVFVRLWTEGDTRIIEVEDNAGGIDPSIVPRLFEAFATTREHGTGLGLYMSRRLVAERFGGSLELREGAAGACFRIELPPREPSDEAASP